MTGEAPRATDTFTLPGTFTKDDKGNRVPATALIYMPTSTQVASLARMADAMEHNGGSSRQVILFAELVCSLFVEQDEWDRFERALLRGEVSDEAYGDFVQAIMRHFYPAEEEEAPRTGPRATRRPTKAARRR